MSRRKAGLTLDEQLVAFVEKWSSARSAQCVKWRTRADKYQREYGNAYPTIAAMTYAESREKQKNAQHELAMLQELLRRAVPRKAAVAGPPSETPGGRK